jgi:CheY-like chemotaxis protein
MVYLMDGERKRPIRILLAAENDEYIKDVWVEFQKLRLGNSVYPVKSGYDVLDFLCQIGKYRYPRHETPDLILLGMQLAEMEGIRVLAHIKQIKQFSKISIILLGSSNGEKLSGWLNAKGKVSYLPKPFDGNKFLERVARLDVPWRMSEELSASFPRLRMREIHEVTKVREG